MRAPLFMALASLAACNWADFDDLADTTWVRSTETPAIGSRNFAVSVLGLTPTGAPGGRLGVISDDAPDYSTIEYSAEGADTAGSNDLKLGQHRIAALTDPPIFVTDGAGNVGIVERSTTGGNIAVVFGSSTSPAGLEFAAPASPDAAVWADGKLVVAAGNTFYTLEMGMQVPCASMDTSLRVRALAADATTLWVWTETGTFFSVPISALSPCGGGNLPAPGTTFTTTGFMPAASARIHLVGSYAVLTAHPPTSRMGQVFVVDTTSLMQTDVLTIEGLRSSAIASYGGTSYVVAGVPDRAVDGVVAGQVELLELSTTTGMLTRTPALVLNDAQPESGQLFGRSVTTMLFNNETILVVAASNEVFAYYKTALYDALP